uniref:Uncharacterized protein n=1 Tax=viral metagenome TaxID=1070528 RepID=A0A6C0BET6_9ZZZZ
MNIEGHMKISTLEQVVIDCIKTDNEIKSRRIGLLEDMIKSGIISSNEVLVILVKEMKTIADLGILSVIMRNGADANLYVNVKSMGPAHILVYAFSVLTEQLFIKFYNIMILKGSSTILPCYESEKHKAYSIEINEPLDSNSQKYGHNSNIIMESVKEWISNKKNSNLKILNTASEIYTFIKSNECSLHDKQIYSAYLDDETITDWTPDFLSLMLNSRNSKWNKVIYKEILDSRSEMDSNNLKVAVNATFFDLVVSMLNLGMRPSYIDFTFWIAHYKHIKSYSNVEFFVNQCEMMFIELIKRGYQIDTYCIDEIGFINPSFRARLIDEYEKPLWRKICSFRNDEYIPDELKNVSIYLGFSEDMNKETICNNVESITIADFESIKDANRRKNSQMIGRKVNLITDFINSNGEGYCTNSESFSDNPLDYPDILLSYYKDSDSKTYCFLSKDFENLIHTKVNPSTQKKLPFEFIKKLEANVEILKHFKIPLSDPKTIDRILTDIKKDDKITNDKTDSIIIRIKDILNLRGITEDQIMKSISLKVLISKFLKIGVDIQKVLLISDTEINKTISNAISDFSPRMMFNLVCLCLYDKLKKDISVLDNFMIAH